MVDIKRVVEIRAVYQKIPGTIWCKKLQRAVGGVVTERIGTQVDLHIIKV